MQLYYPGYVTNVSSQSNVKVKLSLSTTLRHTGRTEVELHPVLTFVLHGVTLADVKLTTIGQNSLTTYTPTQSAPLNSKLQAMEAKRASH